MHLNHPTVLIASCLTLLNLTACDPGPQTGNKTADTAIENEYAGSNTCGTCHEDEHQRWQNSHHDLAMQPATTATIAGDFSDSSFEHQGVTSRFFTRENQFYIETHGANGKLASFPVRYTFGIYPLQQYLLELPNGKIQAFSIAWDTRPVTEGGQHWFHVYGNDPIDHNDVLHWTQPSQNWETMCADCHSTNLISRYDIDADSFDTTWAELNVGCEACHGPGAQHIVWAESGAEPESSDKGLSLSFTESNRANWIPDPASGNSTREPPREKQTELNACAGCHSRRARIAEGNHPATPFTDNYSPALIDQRLYHADGQILDEVYVYGSFLQSRMHAAGVTCSDCHDPHSLELRAPGPAVCLQCHAADKFATADHSMHAPDVANCIDCHMPATNYMQIDARNDHSFRIPRPQLTSEYDAPNACTNCHRDQTPEWAAQAIPHSKDNNGETELHWTELLPIAGTDSALTTQISAQLASDTGAPGIIRATAAARLALGNSDQAENLLTRLAADPDPLVRMSVARALQNSDPALTAKIAPGLLDDTSRLVRINAAAAVAGIDPVMLPGGSYNKVRAGLDEYRATQMVSSERAEAHVNLANVEAMAGNIQAAEDAYRLALKVNPSFVPAYINLADLYRATNREIECDNVLRQGLEQLPGQSYLEHSLGLSLIRQQKPAEALPYLKSAAQADDASARFALVYVIALTGMDEPETAKAFLENALLRYPGNPELENAYRELGL